MAGLRAILTIATIPLLLLDLAAGVTGGVWLARDGYWNVVAMGLGATFIGVSVVSAVPIPSLLLALPAAVERSTAAGAAFGAIASSVFVYGVMGGWAVALFFLFGDRVEPAAALPAALWSYAAATTVWTILAQKQRQSENGNGAFAAFFNQIACAALAVYALTHAGDLEAGEMAAWFAAPMTICLVLQLTFMFVSKAR